MQKGVFSHSYEKISFFFFCEGVNVFLSSVRPQLGPWSNVSLAHKY